MIAQLRVLFKYKFLIYLIYLPDFFCRHKENCSCIPYGCSPKNMSCFIPSPK